MTWKLCLLVAAALMLMLPAAAKAQQSPASVGNGETTSIGQACGLAFRQDGVPGAAATTARILCDDGVHFIDLPALNRTSRPAPTPRRDRQNLSRVTALVTTRCSLRRIAR